MYTVDDIKTALTHVGLTDGDDIFIHSNLGFYGLCHGAKTANDLAKCFWAAIYDIVGDKGTIIVPTFTYSGCKGQDFDPVSTPCQMGILSDYVLNLPQAIRSLDSNFSVTAVGKRALYYTQNASTNSYDDNSFFARMLKQDCKILGLNFDAGTTFVHYVERKCRVAYRYDKKFSSRIKNGDIWQTVDSYHFVYDLDKPQDAAHFSRLHEEAIKQGVAKVASLAKGTVLLQSSQELFALIEKTLLKRPRFLTKEE